jgi:hypothetical protein
MDVIKEESNMKTEPDPLTGMKPDVFPNLIMLREPKIEEIVSHVSICFFCSPVL